MNVKTQKHEKLAQRALDALEAGSVVQFKGGQLFIDGQGTGEWSELLVARLLGLPEADEPIVTTEQSATEAPAAVEKQPATRKRAKKKSKAAEELVQDAQPSLPLPPQTVTQAPPQPELPPVQAAPPEPPQASVTQLPPPANLQAQTLQPPPQLATPNFLQQPSIPAPTVPTAVPNPSANASEPVSVQNILANMGV